MIVSAIARAVGREDLSRELARASMEQILNGDATGAQIAALAIALRLAAPAVLGDALLDAAARRPSLIDLPVVGDLIVERLGSRITTAAGTDATPVKITVPPGLALVQPVTKAAIPPDAGSLRASRAAIPVAVACEILGEAAPSKPPLP